MNTATFFRSVDDMLETALVASIDDAVREFASESIYAIILYPSGGFAGFALAVSSRERIAASAPPSMDAELLEMLHEHPDLMAQASEHAPSPSYTLLTACEWDYFAEKRFADLNEFLDANYDTLYDHGITPQQMVDSFADVVIGVFKRLTTNGCFGRPTIEPDPFLGFQYPDTDNRPLMLHVSERVNSPEWHKLAVAEWGQS